MRSFQKTIWVLGAISFLGSFLTCLCNDLYVPDQYATIQGAIRASVNGDSVIVRPGVYYERIDFEGKLVSLQSEIGPEVTVIDGQKGGSVVTFKSSLIHRLWR